MWLQRALLPSGSCAMVEEKGKKPKRKFKYTIFLVVVCAIFYISIGQLGGEVLALSIADALRGKWIPDAVIDNGLVYFAFIGIHISFLLYFLIFRRDLIRRFFYGYRNNNVRAFLIGLGIGFATNGFCILIAWLAGDIRFETWIFSPWYFVLFLCVLIQSSAEELACRGFMYEVLIDNYHPVIAVLVNSLLFSALHAFNPGVKPIALVSIFLTGVEFSLMVYYFGSLWMAYAAHTMWNFTQAFIFGLPNSGNPAGYAMLRLKFERDSVFYDTAFGVESTITALIADGLVCLVILYLIWRKKKNEQNSVTV